MTEFKKRAIPQTTRRAVALRYGCPAPGSVDGVPCHWCGATGRITWFPRASGEASGWVWFSHELDHVTPEVLGGDATPDNIVLACRTCNRRRGHRSSRHAHESFMNYDGATPPGREGKGREQGRGRTTGSSSSSFPSPDVSRGTATRMMPRAVS